MSEAPAISKVFYFFVIVSFASGFSLICFTDLRPAPVGKILQFKAKAYPYKWPLRTGLLVLLLLCAILAFFAAFKENHRINIVMAFLIFLLLIVEVSMAGKHLSWRNEQSTTINKQGDGNTMLQQYGIDAEITRIMDMVQSSYSCCGITDYRDWATSMWAAQVQKANAVPQSCCKMPGPGCGDDLDIKDPFENIFVQGCTQLLYFSKLTDNIHGGVGMAVLFLHWCSTAGCVLLACAITTASGLTPIQALKGEESDQGSDASNKKSGGRSSGGSGGKGSSGGKGGSGKSPKKQAKSRDGARRTSGDELDFAEENKPPKGARNMLIDKSEQENNQTAAESELSEAVDTS